MAEAIAKQIILEQAFREYCRYDNPKSDGTKISLTSSDKWLTDAGIIDGKKVSPTDTAIAFRKFNAKTIDFKQYLLFLDALSKDCKLNLDQFIETLSKVPTLATGTSGSKNIKKMGNRKKSIQKKKKKS